MPTDGLTKVLITPDRTLVPSIDESLKNEKGFEKMQRTTYIYMYMDSTVGVSQCV